MGITREAWASLRHLVGDPDPRIAVLACELCLRVAPDAEWDDAVRRLIGFLEYADWRLEGEVEECLVRSYPKAANTISAMLHVDCVDAGDEIAPSRTREILLRVRERGERLELRERARWRE
jgi:hypothetical protein